ncbi:MAG: HEPN domain-containing protein [Deltaproteobacteria bacterium]|nr:HEPN domain-containing protein [Deltaproteobacteria bacterium]
MRAPEQVKWDFVQQWLDKARKDLAAGEVLLKEKFEDYENVGFHAQQAAEKFIKAFLVCHQIEFPKSHDIALLRQLVARVDPRLSEKLATADALTPYGVEFRYPGDLPSVTRKEGQKALRLAEETRELIMESLKSYLDTGRPGGAKRGEK